METYCSSTQALEQLCKEQQPKFVRPVLRRLTGWIPRVWEQSDDGRVYYWGDDFYRQSDGFVRRHTPVDRICGNLVTPIDQLEDAAQVRRGYLFVNGFSVAEREFRMDMRRKTAVYDFEHREWVSEGKRFPIGTHSEYALYFLLTLSGDIAGQRVQVVQKTLNENSGENLNMVGSKLWLLGERETDGTIRLQRFGKAVIW